MSSCSISIYVMLTSSLLARHKSECVQRRFGTFSGALTIRSIQMHVCTCPVKLHLLSACKLQCSLFSPAAVNNVPTSQILHYVLLGSNRLVWLKYQTKLLEKLLNGFSCVFTRFHRIAQPPTWLDLQALPPPLAPHHPSRWPQHLQTRQGQSQVPPLAWL